MFYLPYPKAAVHVEMPKDKEREGL
jgi:hypothetical protein